MSFLKQTWTLLLYEADLVHGNEILVTDHEFHYINNVLRLKSGDIIELSNGIGIRGVGQICAMSKKSCSLLVTHVEQVPKRKYGLHILLAQPKQSALEESIFTASEIGVDSIHIFPADKIVSKQPLKIEKLQKISNEAMRISKSAYSAKIVEHKNLSICLDFVQEKFSSAYFLFCDEEADKHIIQFQPKRDILDMCLMIGSEGSFSVRERELIFNLPSLERVSLGANILRTQTAVTCAGFFLRNYL